MWMVGLREEGEGGEGGGMLWVVGGGMGEAVVEFLDGLADLGMALMPIILKYFGRCGEGV